jgi:putative transposase
MGIRLPLHKTTGEIAPPKAKNSLVVKIKPLGTKNLKTRFVRLDSLRLNPDRLRGSKSRKRLVKSKQRQLAKLKNQIKDILHKTTSLIVSTLKSRGVQTLGIGDVRDIRANLDYGNKSNQKLHQWVFGEMRHMLTYKALRQGMNVELINEAYTSQTCRRAANAINLKTAITVVGTAVLSIT